MNSAQYYLSKDSLQTLLATPDISRLNKILMILFWNDEIPKSISEIKSIGLENGLREIGTWNISDTLGKSQGKAVLIKGTWSITGSGKLHLAELNYLQKAETTVKKDVTDLRAHLSKVGNLQTREFIEEAVACLESNRKRAAVVLSWIGAIAILYDEVVKNHLAAFNAEAIKRDSKWKAAKTNDDLAKMKEFDFLNVLEVLSVIGKNVKQELQQSLQLRNACGHPNSLTIGIRKVAAHIEILILNVFSKF